MGAFDRFWSRAGREVTVYWGGAARDRVLGMSVDEVYRTQPELQAVVSFIATSVAQLPLKCYLRESDQSRPRDTQGPLPLLLAEPGADVTPYELWLGTVSDVCLYGWALWWVLPSADARSGYELRRISPAWAKAKTSDGFCPSSYEVANRTVAGRPVSIPADQCVRFATYDPTSPVTPLSPVEALRDVLAERASSRTYRNRVWRNGGWFSRYIERPAQDGEWSREARERFAKSIKNRFGGKEGVDSGGIPILEDGMRFVTSALNAKEAEWAESMRLTREDVAAAYHLNPAQVWSNDGQTYASVRENARSLYADTLGPYLRMLQDRVNMTLAPMVGADARSYAEFDLSAKLAGSFEEQATVMSQSVGGPWMTRNEARARQNMPAVEGGDELIVPMNVTEGGLANPHDTAPGKGSETEPKGCAPGKDTARVGGGSGAGVTPAPFDANAAADPPMVDDGMQVLLKSMPWKRDEQELEKVLTKFYKRSRNSVVNAIRATNTEDLLPDGDGFPYWWTDSRWMSELGEDFERVCFPMMQRAADKAAGSLGHEPSQVEGDTLARECASICNQRARQICSALYEQIVKDMRAAEGELTPDKAAEAVQAGYNRLMKSRTRRNSRSMAQQVANAGTVEGARLSGVECEKEWVCIGHNSRASHALMNGQRVRIDEKFTNGARWPGDTSLPARETCNCHCHLKILKASWRGDTVFGVSADIPDTDVTNEAFFSEHDTVAGTVSITSDQLGRKSTSHAADFGLDESVPEDRTRFRKIILAVLRECEEVLDGEWHGNGVYPALFFRLADDIVVVKRETMEFVSIFEGGVSKHVVQSARHYRG